MVFLCVKTYFLLSFRLLKISLVQWVIRLKFLCKNFIRNDMFDLNVFNFFGINTRNGKVLPSLIVRWEFPFLGQVKINTNGVVRSSPDFAICGGIFLGSMREFIGGFFDFFDVQTALVGEFYGITSSKYESYQFMVLM